jgi:carbamoyltransferase
MIILGINRSNHDASIALLKNNEVVLFIESERLSNIKHDDNAFQAIAEIKKYTDHIDYLILSGFNPPPKYEKWVDRDAYSSSILALGKTFINHGFETFDVSYNHHATHAMTAFYNSGFKTALCIVKDGAGSYYKINDLNYPNVKGRETNSSFLVEYPAKINIVEQDIFVPFKIKNKKIKFKDNIFFTNSISEGTAFEITSEAMGLDWCDGGKVMGMSPYGKNHTESFEIYKDGLINSELFKNKADDRLDPVLNIEISKDFQSKANFAYSLQNQVQENVANEIIEKINKTGEKNLCLSGGFFLNCVSNYHLLKKLPKDINIYVEPISTDSGNAIGAAKYLYYTLTQSEEIKSQKNIYYGLEYNYSQNDLKNEKVINNITPYDVAKIISEKNIVAIYQGRSEAGPRALGNRSILYDPRDPNGKDHVNTVKKREWFRPFAGSVLKEEAKNWFDLRSLDESKFMMFAVDVLKDKQSIVPAITHVDGTCRIQTVSKEDNKNFYNLIKEFYKITNVPILFNTSFNLAGDAIVETLEDALWTLKNSKIDFLYLPEMSILIQNPNAIIE